MKEQGQREPIMPFIRKDTRRTESLQNLARTESRARIQSTNKTTDPYLKITDAHVLRAGLKRYLPILEK